MRWDMDKVIVERPRLGSRANNDEKGALKLRQREAVDVDLSPKRSSTARRRRKIYKNLNEHLAPLRRFLNSRVGRHWDKVYAEIRQRINPDSTQQMHILQHVVGRFGYVQPDVKAAHDGTFTDLAGRPLHGEWFVNPKTGCLQKNLDSYRHGGRRTLRRPHVMPRPVKARYLVAGGKFFREIDGVWYEVGLRPVPEPRLVRLKAITNAPWVRQLRPDPPVYDAILHDYPTFDQLDAEHGCRCYAATKRQLGSREIRKHGLRPQPVALPDSPTRR
jgi:hypothetical protein